MLHPDQISLLYGSLGIRIKELREQSKYNQTRFARLLKISRASLVNIEKGRQRAPIHIIYEIARLLKVEVSYLLPPLNTIVATDIDEKIKLKIDESSKGNELLQEKLIEFVKINTFKIKK